MLQMGTITHGSQTIYSGLAADLLLNHILAEHLLHGHSRMRVLHA